MSRLLTSLRLAVHSVKAHRLRSLLTIVSIATGVSALAGVVAAGEAARQRIARELGTFGTHLIVAAPLVAATDGERRSALTLDDGRAIAREASAISAVAPLLSANASLSSGQRHHRTRTIGTTVGYFEMTRRSAAHGSLFSSLDEAAKEKVCVIGETVRRELWGDADPIGRTLRAGTATLRVVGVLDRKGSDIFGKDQDDLLLMPIESFRSRLMSSPGADVSSLLLAAASSDRVEGAVQQADTILRRRHRIEPWAPSDVTLTAQSAALATLRASVSTLTILLSVIAAVSLAVGGIGVMNMMLLSVKERRREIGVRMAIGARSRDIRDQFMVESVLVSSLGGAAGLVVTWLVIFAARQLLPDWPLELNLQALLVGFATSAVVGALFGLVPAYHASQIEPQLALVRD